MPKKLTESCPQEFIIDQNEIPPEIVEYMLVTKQSKAPEITVIDHPLTNESESFINVTNPPSGS